MNHPPSNDDLPPVQGSIEHGPSFWKKLGGGSLSISIIVHAALLVIGLFWIFQSIPEKKPEVDFMPKGGGGGQQGAKSEVTMKKRATMTPANAPRVAAKDVVSNFTLPEPDAASAMSSVGALGGGGLSGGLGGSGSGGGSGDGQGKGFGSGMGPGLGGGAGSMSPFGMIDPNANALVGTFYNINRRSDGNELNTDNSKQWDIVNDFVTRGWRDSGLSKFQAAPKKLYQTRIYMPAMNAAEAPKAFGMTPDPHPRWIVVYRGTIVPPKSGKYRFVGAGDDSLAVRFNNRNVFDFGFIAATVKWEGFIAALSNPKGDRNALRGCPMEAPVTFYQYPTTANWNTQIGGCAVGPEFEVQAGKEYPIDILICEGWGGLFAASLMIEEVGATYQKSSTGAPVLPLFRTDGTLPGKLTGDNQPPYDPQGSNWTVVRRTRVGDI